MKKKLLMLAAFVLLNFTARAQKSSTIDFQNIASGFIENKGQIIDQFNQPNPNCLFLFNYSGLNIQLRKTGFSYDVYEQNKENGWINCHRIDIEFLNCNRDIQIVKNNPCAEYLNYYTTGTPENGITGVQKYQTVLYKNVYSNIDIEFLVLNGKVKYNIIIHPGGNIENIKFKYLGVDNIDLTETREIEILTSLGKISETIPLSYISETNKEVKVNFALNNSVVSFTSETFNPGNTLVIDPTPNRIWGTYYGGGNAQDQISEVDAGSGTDLFIAGLTDSPGNIATAGTFQTSFGGGASDGFVAKLNSSNGQRIWGTYFGGSNSDYFYGLDVDASGNAVAAGWTQGSTGLASAGAHQTVSGGSIEGLVAKFDANGLRLWSTYYGGTGFEQLNDVAIDQTNNNIYIGGYSTSSASPTIVTVGSNQTVMNGTNDGIVIKFDPNGTRLWASFFGGNGGEMIYGLAMDANNDLLITGNTSSTTGLSTAGAYQIAFGGGSTDAMIGKLDKTGVTKIWASYYGGSGDDAGGVSGNYGGSAIAVDANNNVLVTGSTTSATGMSSVGAYQAAFGGGSADAYVLQLNSSGTTRIWATYFGGPTLDETWDLTVDPADNVIVVGRTNSTTGIATAGAYQTTFTGFVNAIIAKFTSSGTIVYGTYFGGGSDGGYSATIDNTGNLYMCGWTGSTTGMATAGTFQTTMLGTADGYVEKFDNICTPPQPGTISGLTTICSGSGNTYSVAAVNGATSYTWTLPSGWTGTSTTNSINTTASSTSGNITVTANNACGSSTPQTLAITVNPVPSTPSSISGNTTICSGSSNTYSVTNDPSATSYTWTLPSGWSGTSTTNSINTTASTTSGNITVTANNACGSSTPQTLAITVNTIPATPGTISGNTTICSGSSNTYSVTNDPTATSYTWTLPGGWTGTSTTNSINTIASTTSGNITVTANNACGSSTQQTLAVTVNTVPSTPGTISGNTAICSGSNNTYSVTNDPSATSYTWTLPGGWSGTSTTNSITTTASTTSGNITVTANNSCGSSTQQTLAVTVNTIPSTPGTISGNTTICSGSNNTYSVTNDPSATSYTWTLPGGWTGTSTTNSINTTASATSGNITVTANNACGSSTQQTLAITVNTVPSTPGTISGNTSICSGSNNTYSVTNDPSAASYTWTLPGGWTGTSTTNSINTTASSTSGSVTVTANNSCGSSTQQTLSVTVNALPTVTANATDNDICEGDPTTLTGGGASSYVWTGGVTDGVAFNPAATLTYTVTGTDANLCSNTATITVTVNTLPNVTFTYPGADTVCVSYGIQTLSGGSPSGGTYSGIGVTGTSFDPNSAGLGSHTITYSFTDVNSCSNTDIITITVIGCAGIEDNNNSSITVYPNPFTNSISLTGIIESTEVRLYNALGEVIGVWMLTETNHTINTEILRSGVYFLNAGTITKKIIKH